MSNIHRIEAQPIPERYARGWHCLGKAENYKDGKAHTIQAFGTRLVAFQGEDGEIHILNAYCPHMGADLSKGCIEGNTIRCPFHDWRWNSEGVCDDIPYSKRIPPRAKIKAWPTCEQNKLLFIWNDHEGKPPIKAQAIPQIDVCYDDQWADWEISEMHIATNCRELVDNVADKAHFGPVHGAPVKLFANVFEGHTAQQTMIGTSRRLPDGSELKSVATYYGPSYQITHMSGEVNGIPMYSKLLNCHVPIDQNNFTLRFGVMVKNIPGLTREQNREAVRIYIKTAQEAFFEDVSIWDNKVRIDNPLLCEGDGPVYQLRKWYEQFYTDAALLGGELQERKEFKSEMKQAV